VRDPVQVLVLMNRHDWLSATNNELGWAIACERLLGVEVPERAQWIRTMMAEWNRVLNHLMFTGSFPLELRAMTSLIYYFFQRGADGPAQGRSVREVRRGRVRRAGRSQRRLLRPPVGVGPADVAVVPDRRAVPGEAAAGAVRGAEAAEAHADPRGRDLRANRE